MTTATTDRPAIEVRDLSRRYGRRWALARVGFDVPRGALFIVAGRNGAGKSTLLRLLATALRPHHGSIVIDGLDAVRDRWLVRKRTALLAHASYTWDSLSALENLSIVARSIGRDASRRSLESLLDEVGLEGRGDDPIATFSAGMRKRIAFARILLQEPSVLLLDEPYGQLDPPGFAWVDAMVRSARARGTTVVMATHQLEHVVSQAQSGLLLEQGRVVSAGDIAAIASRLGGGVEA